MGNETGLEIPELTAANCGQLLLGVEQSVFRRAGFIRQSDMPVTQDAALRRRLNDLVTTGDETGDAQRLEKALKDLKNRCRYNRSGLLPQAEKEREELKEKLAQLRELEDQTRKLKLRIGEEKSLLRELENHSCALRFAQAERDAQQLARARDDMDLAESRLARLENTCAGAPSRQTAEEKQRQIARFCEEWEQLRQQTRQQLQLPEPPRQEPPFQGLSPEDALEMAQRDGRQLRRQGSAAGWILLLAGLLTMGAAAVLYLKAWLPAALAAAVLSAVLLILGLISRGRIGRIRKEFRQKYGDLDTEGWQQRAMDHGKALAAYRSAEAMLRGEHAAMEDRRSALEIRRQALCGDRSPEAALQMWQRLQAQWDDLEHARAEAARARQQYSALQTMVREAPRPAMEDLLTYSPEDTARLTAETTAQLHRLQHHLGQQQGRMEMLGEAADLEGAMRRTELRIEKLEQTYGAATLALDTLAQARLELQRRFAPRISRRAQEWMRRLTNGRYTRLTLSEDLSLLAAAEEEALQEILWRSDGTVDQLYLALRLAVAEVLTPHAPLVLDDVFVRFDDQRLRCAMDILSELAREKQVILFTCQSREKEAIQ